MCWTRSLCCRCPASFPCHSHCIWAKSRRRRPRAQLNIPCNPWPDTYRLIISTSPPAWATPRHVHFHQSPPPVYVANPPTPVVPMVPFIPGSPHLRNNGRAATPMCQPRSMQPQSTKAALDGAATFPPTNLITLSFADNPVLGHWERQWGPSSRNVLDAVYQYFNQPLSPADFATTSTHAWGSSRTRTARRGALRLDVLNGATKFSGLQCIGRDYFQLNLTT
ncbi:hypothetical protein B0H10DRAFT_2097290 [Mycena sp. CBHHK59/15]|nr:hypothetical protein B0H10DRAFT_2097290 [Mycena sp. CBHHK59/15]